MSESLHCNVLKLIREEIADLENQLLELKAVEVYHAKRAGSDDAFGSVSEMQLSTNGRHGRFASMTMRDAAVMVLREAKAPLSTRAIANLLSEGGYPTKNPEGLRNAVFSALYRKSNSHLFRKQGGKWLLREGEAK